MKIQRKGANVTIILKDDGTEIMVSYSTPVAGFVPGTGYVRTDRKWSATTSKHISQYLGATAGKVTVKPQSYFDSLL